jgi:hypothetical protein
VKPSIPGTTIASAPATPRTLTASGLFQTMATIAVADTITSFLIQSTSVDYTPTSFEKSASLDLLNQTQLTPQRIPSEYTPQSLMAYFLANPTQVYFEIACYGQNSQLQFEQIINMTPESYFSFWKTCYENNNPNNTTVNISNPVTIPATFSGNTITSLPIVRFTAQYSNGATGNVSFTIPANYFLNGSSYTGSYIQLSNVANATLRYRNFGFTDGIISFYVNSLNKFSPHTWEMDDDLNAVQPNSDQIIFSATDDNANPLVTYINISGNIVEYDNQHLDLQTKVRTRNRFHVRASDGKVVNHDNEISQNSEIINYFKANETFQPTGNGTQTQTEIEIKEETQTKTEQLTEIDTELQTLTQTKTQLKTQLENAINTDTYTDSETQQEYDFIGKIDTLFNEFSIQDINNDLPDLENISLIPKFTPGDPVQCEPIPINYQSLNGKTDFLNANAGIDICDKLGLARDLLGYTFYLVTLFFGWRMFYQQGRNS